MRYAGETLLRDAIMDYNELEARISEELQANSTRVVNKNALSALIGAFGGPTAAIASLGKIFLGRNDALDSERHRIERQCVIKLLCSIDEALKDGVANAQAQGVQLDGLIETRVIDADYVIGVDIDAGQNVVFAPGTRIKTDAERVSGVVGLRIGGERPLK